MTPKCSVFRQQGWGSLGRLPALSSGWAISGVTEALGWPPPPPRSSLCTLSPPSSSGAENEHPMGDRGLAMRRLGLPPSRVMDGPWRMSFQPPLE